MKILPVAALVALIHDSYATLHIKGPNGTILRYAENILECWYSDSDHNISQVHFEYRSLKWDEWTPVRINSHWCLRYISYDTWIDEHLFLSIIGSRADLLYRCASDAENVTMADKYSEPLTLNLHYLRGLSLSMKSNCSYLSVPQELKVQPGEDVVVNCSVNSSSREPNYSWKKDGVDLLLPSTTLSLRKITAADGGQYTCKAVHPMETFLDEQRSFRITVLDNTPWYESSYGCLLLMTSAAAVSLLVSILCMSVFLWRRAKQAKTSKGPIDDRSQKKPIYKASVESLPSTCADKQPLV